MRILLGALAVVLAVVLWSVYRTHVNEQRLGEVESALAGRPVGVDCQSFVGGLVDIGWRAGEVEFDAAGRPGNKAFLTRKTCKDLEKLWRADDKESVVGCVVHARLEADKLWAVCRSGASIAGSVKVLAHEAQHLRGITDEAAAECYGIESTAFTARALGATEQQADALAEFAWLSLRYMPQSYVSPECHPGGELDLHPETTAWPSA